MQKSRLVITAGHQGAGTGAARQWFDEGKEAIVLRDLITAALAKRKIKAINDSNADSLPKVLAWLNSKFNDRDVLVEIHFNASVSPQATGTEVFVQANPNDLELKLAGNINDITADTLEISERGVKKSSLSQHTTIAILDRTKMNAVLWEVCFLSNREDCERYWENRERLVERIADELSQYVTAA
jgi:N-acetylmuramoyl-L-alanine amidase